MRIYKCLKAVLTLPYYSVTNITVHMSQHKRISVNCFSKKIVLYFLVSLNLISCTKLADVPAPSTAATGTNVYQEDATAAAVLSGVYANLGAGIISGGKAGISFLTGLSSDELNLVSPAFNEALVRHYTNSLSPELDGFNGLWSLTYNQLLVINTAIEGLSSSTALTPKIKDQLLGEALFMRGFLYFYLVNLYGDVPLILTSDYRINSRISRNSASDVYNQIVEDLKIAAELLSLSYLGADALSISSERVRPTKWAAMALLARVYLYLEDWVNAEVNATEVIENSNIFNLVGLNDVFLKNNSEVIWQLMAVEQGLNTPDGRVFIPTYGFDYFSPAALSEDLVNAFESNDLRKDSWTNVDPASGLRYAFKYKKDGTYNSDPDYSPDEYLMVLRLAELYLVRAESRIQAGNVSGGIEDINLIRNRASKPAPEALPLLQNTLSKQDALKALEHENRVEFFCEWGHRWFDLKRLPGFSTPATKRIDEVMPNLNATKGSMWESTDRLYPIPLQDIKLNPNLSPQNPGY